MNEVTVKFVGTDAAPPTIPAGRVVTKGRPYTVLTLRTLRDLRTQAGLLLVDLETATGINRGHLSEIERGLRLATRDQTTAIAAALNLAPEDFALRCVLVHEERA